MKKKRAIKLLDCTLRDGGYYNNWKFSHELAQDYLNDISSSGISYVELGFRGLKKGILKGPNWHTTDKYINSLKIPKNLKKLPKDKGKNFFCRKWWWCWSC